MSKKDDETVLISLSIDSKKLAKILMDYKFGEIEIDEAQHLINDLYEYNARNFQLKLNMEANDLIKDQLAMTKEAYDTQHQDLQELIRGLAK